MKTLKKVLSLVMVLALVLSFTVVAFADDEAEETVSYSVTVPTELQGHTLVAYKIFDGYKGENGFAVTDWAKNGLDVDAFIEALADLGFGVKAGDSAQAVAEALETLPENVTKEDIAKAVKDCGGTGVAAGSVQEAGYYVIVDESDPLPEGEVYNPAILLVVDGDVTFKQKANAPSLEKKVSDNADGDDDKYYEGTVAAKGEYVSFQLTITLPSEYDGFENYTLKVTDKLPEGLVYDSGSTATIVTDGDGVIGDVAFDNNDGTLTWTFGNLKDEDHGGFVAGDTITITYTVKVIADVGVEINEAKLEFTNDPYWDGEGDSPTGETPWDPAVVIVLQFNANKVDGQSNEALPGATFELSSKKTQNAAWGEAVELEASGDPANIFTLTGLEEGWYMLEETNAPDGYNKLTAPIYFRVEFTRDQAGNVTAIKVYETDEDGNAVEGGIVYADLTISVDVTNPTSDDDLTIDTNVKNNKGVTLPETGGIGTTIFYVVGAILVAGAAILLVTKRRMNGAAD